MESSADAIRNRVNESGLTTLDLDDLITRKSIVNFDLADCLENGLILRERPFREALKALNAEDWNEKVAALQCSNDAIIPEWAWMLATSRLAACGAEVAIGNAEEAKQTLLIEAIQQLPLDEFRDARIVIKGCSSGTNAASLAKAIRHLQPVAMSIFYGEPCSTVPVYKRPRKPAKN
tara:strand:+ start:3182 stop:3712 length:531 start_codon:yes stop_codon:yes gene_type:complete